MCQTRSCIRLLLALFLFAAACPSRAAEPSPSYRGIWRQVEATGELSWSLGQGEWGSGVLVSGTGPGRLTVETALPTLRFDRLVFFSDGPTPPGQVVVGVRVEGKPVWTTGGEVMPSQDRIVVQAQGEGLRLELLAPEETQGEWSYEISGLEFCLGLDCLRMTPDAQGLEVELGELGGTIRVDPDWAKLEWPLVGGAQVARTFVGQVTLRGETRWPNWIAGVGVGLNGKLVADLSDTSGTFEAVIDAGPEGELAVVVKLKAQSPGEPAWSLEWSRGGEAVDTGPDLGQDLRPEAVELVETPPDAGGGCSPGSGPACGAWLIPLLLLIWRKLRCIR